MILTNHKEYVDTLDFGHLDENEQEIVQQVQKRI